MPRRGNRENDQSAGKGSVSRADVALVVAAALNDDSTVGRTIDFNSGDVPIAVALAG